MNLTAAIYNKLAGDGELVGLLAEYHDSPAIFTIDPAPGDAVLPYIVTAGDVTDVAFDTKTTLGRDVMRDIRCYTNAGGSAVLVEQIAERVRELFHRQSLTVEGHHVWIIQARGPIVADEEDAYGRIVSIRLVMQEV